MKQFSYQSPRMLLRLCITILFSSVAHTQLNFKIIYHKMPPFIYVDNTNTLKGIITDIARKASELCNIKFDFKSDTETSENFTDLLLDPSKHERYKNNKEWFWLPMLKQYSKEALSNSNLRSLVLFHSESIEVIVHRDNISIVKKLFDGIYNCRFMMISILLLAITVGSLIWLVVSNVKCVPLDGP